MATDREDEFAAEERAIKFTSQDVFGVVGEETEVVEVGVERDDVVFLGGEGGRAEVGGRPRVVNHPIYGHTVTAQCCFDFRRLVNQEVVTCDQRILGGKGGRGQEGVYHRGHFGGAFHQTAEAVLGQVEFTAVYAHG